MQLFLNMYYSSFTTYYKYIYEKGTKDQKVIFDLSNSFGVKILKIVQSVF